LFWKTFVWSSYYSRGCGLTGGDISSDDFWLFLDIFGASLNVMNAMNASADEVHVTRCQVPICPRGRWIGPSRGASTSKRLKRMSISILWISGFPVNWIKP
jgi:hypothetical protein